MPASLVTNATEVRKNFRHFLDEVVHVRPQAIRRHSDEVVFALSAEHLDSLLAAIRLTLEYEVEADGTISGSLQELPIVENAPSLEALKREIAKSLLEYVEVYLQGFARYYNTPNLKTQLPYIMRLLAQPDIEAVIELIDAPPYTPSRDCMHTM